MKKFKTGFTIVELVIVIAVIGILAAILIPAFSNIIYKANVKSDISACRNMNTALLAARDDVNNENVDFVDACSTLVNAGYPVGVVMPKIEGSQFCFDTDLGKVLYVDTETQKAVFPSEHIDRTVLDAASNGGTWIPFLRPFENITTDEGMTMTDDYSVLGDTVLSLRHSENYTMDLGGKTLNLNGRRLVIVGDTTGKVTFTNGNIENGQVYINIPNADVEFDANAYESVNWTVMAVRESTMLIKSGAKIDGEIKLLKGHIRLEGGATVANVNIPNDVKGETKLTIDADATVIALRVAAGAMAKAHIINAGTVSFATSNVIVSVPSIAGAHRINYDLINFYGGNGTEAEPYLIGTAAQFNKIYKVLAENPLAGLHFQLINNIDFTGKTIDNADTLGVYVSLTLTGKKLPNSDQYPTIRGIGNFNGDTVLFDDVKDSKFENFNVHYAAKGSYVGFIWCIDGTVDFINVDTFGNIEASVWGVGYVLWTPNKGIAADRLTYKDCDSYVNISGSASYAAAFGANFMGHEAQMTTFDNCANHGTIIANNASAFIGMGGNDQYKTRFTFIGTNRNFGNIFGTTAAGVFHYGTTTLNNNITNTGTVAKITSFTLPAPQNYGDSLVIPAQAGAAKYTVKVSYATQMFNFSDVTGQKDRWSGGFFRYFTRTYDAPASGNLTTEFKKLYFAEPNMPKFNARLGTPAAYEGVYAPAGFKYDPNNLIHTFDGKSFYYSNLDNYHGLLDSGQISDPNKTYPVYIDVYAYDAAGNLIGFGSCSYSYTIAEAREYLGGN